MQISIPSCELTYCLNIHPGEGWLDVKSALQGPTREIKAAVCPDSTFAVGLRLSAQAVSELASPQALRELKQILCEEDYKAITVNGFPYGTFHGVAVKEHVYRPDWREESRFDYTCALAGLMASIAPAGQMVSLSTVPGAFRPLGIGEEANIADRILRVVAHCVELVQCSNVTVAIAIEPEPYCLMETMAEAAAFFDQYLFSDSAVRRLAQLTGLDRSAAADALARHLGICYDVCHAAVEFEDPAQSMAVLSQVGVPIHKLQLSAALRIPDVSAEARSALAAFNEPTYLHQVVCSAHGILQRFPDLPQALAHADSANDEEWRVHYHVPIFVEDLGLLATTQPFLIDILDMHVQSPLSSHLEVETYTFGVLPHQLAACSVVEAVSRELCWVIERLSI